MSELRLKILDFVTIAKISMGIPTTTPRSQHDKCMKSRPQNANKMELKVKLPKILLAIANCLMLASFASIVAAQSWPTKPIRIVLGFPPGGATDILSRDFAAKLAEELKQQVIIENKPGAGGTIGADIAAKAPADGYTLTIGTSSNHAIAVSLYKKLPYDPIKDFAPITMLAVSQNVVVINPGVPAPTQRPWQRQSLGSHGLRHPGSERRRAVTTARQCSKSVGARGRTQSTHRMATP